MPCRLNLACVPCKAVATMKAMRVRGYGSELRLRGLDPPYDAVKQELATRFAGMDEATQRKAGRKFAREIGMFIRESDKSLH
jgi:hypothetical protein